MTCERAHPPLEEPERPVLRRTLLLMGAMPLAVQFKPLLAQIKKVPPATIAAHLAGRLAGTPNGDFQLIGYVTYVEGLGGNLFAGAPSEQTALISFRTDPFRFNVIPNGTALQVSRQIVPGGPPSQTRIYYNPAPARDFTKPETFSTGQQIGVLQARSFQGILVPSQMFSIAGSMDVTSTNDLVLGGVSVNLNILSSVITITFAGVPPSAAEFAAATSVSIPLSGTIVVGDPQAIPRAGR
jgi:hypothetical protein